MIAAIGGGVGRLTHAIGAPFRWATRRRRRATALHMLRQAKAVYGPKADLTVWDGKLRGGVGVLDVERGRVQIHVDDEGYLIQWFGECGSNAHPIRHDQVRTTDDITLEAMAKKWTARWYVHERRPSAGPHHMEI